MSSERPGITKPRIALVGAVVVLTAALLVAAGLADSSSGGRGTVAVAQS